MKRIRRSRAARVLSWLLTAVMIAPIISGLFQSSVAAAQGASQGASLQTVIVTDFANKSGVLGEALARRATDAVALELGNSGRYDVFPREEVERQAKDLGLRKPYDQTGLIKLANALGASSVIVGDIVFVKPVGKGGPKGVEAGVRVRMLEGSSGDPVNGAQAVVTAVAKPGLSDDDSLAMDAVNTASVRTVQELLTRAITEGTVVSTVGSPPVVLINRGSRDGVKAGMQFLVLRDRQRVGRIQIGQVFPVDSEAKVLSDTVGVRPEDKVRAIYEEDLVIKPSGQVSRASKGGGSAMSSLSKVLVVVLLGVVIAAAAGGGKNTTVTGVTVEADTSNGSPVVKAIWRDNIFGSSSREYHIWRTPDATYNFQGTPVAAVGSGSRTFVDYASPWSFWDGVRGFLQPPLPGSGGSGSGGGAATATTPAASAVIGFLPGRTYQYQITAVISRPPAGGNGGSGNGGGTTTNDDIGTDPVTSTSVTPINQPLLGPAPGDMANNVNLSLFNPTWLSRTGADVFQLEVSTDRTFMNRNIIARFGPLYSTAPMADGVTQLLSAPVALGRNAQLMADPSFAAWANGVSGATKPTLFWRVGGRNSGDAPGPVHWITKDPKDGDRTFRFVYSQIRSFTPADMPPPAP